MINLFRDNIFFLILLKETGTMKFLKGYIFLFLLLFSLGTMLIVSTEPTMALEYSGCSAVCTNGGGCECDGNNCVCTSANCTGTAKCECEDCNTHTYCAPCP